MSHLNVSSMSVTETAAWKTSSQDIFDGPIAQHQTKEKDVEQHALHTLAAIEYSKGKPPRHLHLHVTIG